MKVDAHTIIIGTILLLLFALLSRFAVLHNRESDVPPEGSWSCAADTEICPDGRVVGRVPPYCLFAACIR